MSGQCKGKTFGVMPSTEAAKIATAERLYLSIYLWKNVGLTLS